MACDCDDAGELVQRVCGPEPDTAMGQPAISLEKCCGIGKTEPGQSRPAPDVILPWDPSPIVLCSVFLPGFGRTAEANTSCTSIADLVRPRSVAPVANATSFPKRSRMLSKPSFVALLSCFFADCVVSASRLSRPRELRSAV